MSLSLQKLLNESDSSKQTYNITSSLSDLEYSTDNFDSSTSSSNNSELDIDYSTPRKQKNMSIQELLNNEVSNLGSAPKQPKTIIRRGSTRQSPIYPFKNPTSTTLKAFHSYAFKTHLLETPPLHFKSGMKNYEFVKVRFTPKGRPWSCHPKGGGGLQFAMVRRHLAESFNTTKAEVI